MQRPTQTRAPLARIVRDPRDAQRDLWVPSHIAASAYARGDLGLIEISSGEWSYYAPAQTYVSLAERNARRAAK